MGRSHAGGCIVKRTCYLQAVELMDMGADLLAEDVAGRTPLDVANQEVTRSTARRGVAGAARRASWLDSSGQG